MSKKIICAVLSLVLTFSAVINSYAASFTDTASHWSSPFVERAYEEGIVKGYPDGTFIPDGKVNHQEAMTMVVNTVNSSGYVRLDLDKASSYRSVLSALGFTQDWAKAFGAALFSAGAAFEDDFSGKAEDPADRQTIGTWVARTLKLPLGALCDISGFTDSQAVSPRYVGYVDALSRCGIMSGYTDGSFGPTNKVTRAEFATVCVNTLDCIEKLEASEGKHLLAEDLFLKTGSIRSLDAKTGSIAFSWGGSYRVASDTVIIADGAAVSLDKLSGLSDKNLVVSFLYGDDSALIIQTSPMAESGKVKSVGKKGDYYSVGILTGSGHIVNYALPADGGLPVPSEGDRVTFIAQGAEILEII